MPSNRDCRGRQGELLRKSVSESSLDELLSYSSNNHVPSSHTTWDHNSTCDNTLAQVSSQLTCLTEEPDEGEDVSIVKKSQIVVQSPHKNKTTTVHVPVLNLPAVSDVLCQPLPGRDL